MKDEGASWRAIGIAMAAGLILAGEPVFGQVASLPPGGAEAGLGGSEEEPQLSSSWETQTEARTLLLLVPGPRGQLTDRHGAPLALNRVQYSMALSLPYLGEVSDGDILEYASKNISLANRTLNENWSIDSEKLLKHYKNRRWLPLKFSDPLADAQVALARKIEGEGLVLHPTYERFYPRGAFAPHVLGYVGKQRKLPTGPIENGEPLFSDVEGRDGLEKAFNEELTGKPGRLNVLYDTQGNKLTQEMEEQPLPGNNVVTTLDAEWQATGERILAEKTKRGALVVMDIYTGEVLVLASWPVFDPNLFIPYISTENFTALQEDEDIPLYARAFRGVYPPASTFKVPVAAAALETGTVDETMLFGCPSSLYIGDRTFRNWNKNGEAPMNVVKALTRSCNTWFYKVGMSTGAAAIHGAATRMGLGRPTGLPLSAEAEGFIPSDEWNLEKIGTKMGGGDIANMSIGQGRVLCSPIQVARMMGAVANGSELPKARLVKQIQDINNRVVKAFAVENEGPVGLSAHTREVVIDGMLGVVQAPDGTAKAARQENMTVAGKTGTGQWGPESENRRVAWFAGFFPGEHPRYCFAALYEGNPGERLGGGSNAGPIVGEFLKETFDKTAIDDVVADTSVYEGVPAVAVAEVIDPGEEGEESVAQPMVPEVVAPEPPRAIPAPQPPPQQPEGDGGGRIIRWWKKLRGR